jgi:parallel beta-helix repeat protein
MKKILFILFTFILNPFGGLSYTDSRDLEKILTNFIFDGDYSPNLAINYYVSPIGNDNNAGTSMSKPFRTIQKALSKAQSGSTIYVQGGLTPYTERLNWINSGMLGSAITLTSYDNNPVIVSGVNGGAQNELLLISSKNYLNIRNFIFHTNYREGAKGIHITGSSSNILIDNVEVYNVGWNSNLGVNPSDGSKHNAHGILVKGTTTTPLQAISIMNSRIHHINSGFSEAVTITGYVYNFFLFKDWVYDCTNIGIDIAGHYPNENMSASLNYPRTGTIRGCTVFNCSSPIKVAAGIYVDGASDIVIEYNRSYRNDVGFSIGCETPYKTASNIRMRGNIATYNKESGLFLGSSNPTSKIINCTVTNNTFALNYQKQGFGSEISLYSNESSILKQNIFLPISNSSVAIGNWCPNCIYTNFQSSYNMYWRLNGNVSNMTTPNVTVGNNAIFQDPKFTKTDDPPNYHLLYGSNAIDRGDPNFAPGVGETDIDFELRIQNQRVDLGADESPFRNLNIIADKQEYQVLGMASIFPNPATNIVNIRFNNNFSGDIMMYDAVGRVLNTYKVEDVLEKKISIETLNNGIYYIKVDSQILKFVK